MSELRVAEIHNPANDTGGITIDNNDNVSINGSPIGNQGALGNRNLIINGAMQVAQRSTLSEDVSDSIVYRTVDRFVFAANGAGPVFDESQSSTAPAGFANSLKIDCTTADSSLDADAYINVTQRFEGFNCQRLQKGTADAQSVTASFWVRSSKTGTYSVELFDSDNTRQITRTYSISTANTWEHKTLTFPGDTSGSLGNDNGNSLSITWWLAAGTDFTSGTYTDNNWAASTNANRISTSQVNFADSTSNDWHITGVQLEVGTNATAFEWRPYSTELALCQRYYVSYAQQGCPGYIETAAANEAQLTHQLPVPMRATPTPTCTTATGIGVESGTLYGIDNTLGTVNFFHQNNLQVGWSMDTAMTRWNTTWCRVQNVQFEAEL